MAVLVLPGFLDESNPDGPEYDIPNTGVLEMTSQKLQFLTVAVILMVGIPASGATIWNNGGPNPIEGNSISDLQQAEDFSLSYNANITAVTFWTLEGAAAYSGSFYYALHSDAAGQPGAVITSGTAAAARSNLGVFLGLDLMENTMAVTINSVLTGSYWLAVHNGPLANDSFFDIYWVWANPNATVPGHENWLNPAIPGWYSTDAEHAFRLEGERIPGGEVPEPGAYALMGAGLAAMLLARKRR